MLTPNCCCMASLTPPDLLSHSTVKPVVTHAVNNSQRDTQPNVFWRHCEHRYKPVSAMKGKIYFSGGLHVIHSSPKLGFRPFFSFSSLLALTSTEKAADCAGKHHPPGADLQLCRERAESLLSGQCCTNLLCSEVQRTLSSYA